MGDAWDPTQPSRVGKAWGLIVVALCLATVIALVIIGFVVVRRWGTGASTATNTIDTTTTPRRVVKTGNEPTRGPDSAPVKIIAFEDFECPFCQQAEPILQRVLGTYGAQVQLIYVDFPLTEVHPHSFAAAVAGECAYTQGKFWEFHDILYPNQSNLAQADLIKYAKQVELDMAQFNECINTQRAVSAVYTNITEGKRLGITGTPTFYINGIEFAGVLTYEGFQRVIDAELVRLGAKNK